jgi:hypothetical protein
VTARYSPGPGKLLSVSRAGAFGVGEGAGGSGGKKDRTLDRKIRSICAGLSSCYFFVVLVIVVIRHETTAAARWALHLVVGAFFNDAIAVAIRAGLHVYLPRVDGHARERGRWRQALGFGSKLQPTLSYRLWPVAGTRDRFARDAIAWSMRTESRRVMLTPRAAPRRARSAERSAR